MWLSRRAARMARSPHIFALCSIDKRVRAAPDVSRQSVQVATGVSVAHRKFTQRAYTRRAVRLTMAQTFAAYEFGRFRLEPRESRLLRDGAPVRLGPKALDLLSALVTRAGHVVTKEELLAEVWPGTFVEEGNLAVNMTALRRALDDGSGAVYIETVPRRGYRFVAPVTIASPAPAVPSVESRMPSVRVEPTRRTSSRWRWVLGGAGVVAVSLVLLLVVQMRWSVESSAPEGTISSVLVARFIAIGGSDDQRHLQLGMADAVITRLGALRQLAVPPLAALKADEDPFAAAARLEIDAVLTGSLQRDGDRIRVVAQLSSAADRRQLWAGRFDALFTDIFDLQDSLAERIASNVLREVNARDRAALHRRETANVQAYELYLKAREQGLRTTPEAIRTAMQMYQDAIARDPNFAMAYAGLADAYTSAASGLPPKERYPLAKQAADRALAIDPHLPDAHTVRSMLAYKADWDWELADGHMQRALEIDPGNGPAQRMYGQLLMLRGRFDESVSALRRAVALDPYSLPARSDLAALLIHGGQLSEARVLLDAGLAQDPESWLMYRTLAELLQAEGRIDQAIEADLKAKQLAGDPADAIASQRDAYRRGGMTALLRQQNEMLLARLGTASTSDAIGLSMYGAASALAVNFARMGDKDQTMRWLEAATERGEEGPLYLNFWHFDFLRDDPRFRALHARVFGEGRATR